LNAPGGWTWHRFSELSAAEIYEVLQLRAEVFVVEQECPYLDPDGMDAPALHCRYTEDGRLLAYQRCLPPGTAFDESSIGRIVVAASQRGSGLGRELVTRGIAFNRRNWPEHAIRIGAQSHLAAFYASLGFISEDDHYLEDGIEHVHMVLPAATGGA
jgi:ElaA protein